MGAKGVLRVLQRFDLFGVAVLVDNFFFKDTAPTEIYPLSLHDALPISKTIACAGRSAASTRTSASFFSRWGVSRDRKSTRLNSSHTTISYAVFCLKKKGTVFQHVVNNVVAVYYNAFLFIQRNGLGVIFFF